MASHRRLEPDRDGPPASLPVGQDRSRRVISAGVKRWRAVYESVPAFRLTDHESRDRRAAVGAPAERAVFTPDPPDGFPAPRVLCSLWFPTAWPASGTVIRTRFWHERGRGGSWPSPCPPLLAPCSPIPHPGPIPVRPAVSGLSRRRFRATGLAHPLNHTVGVPNDARGHRRMRWLLGSPERRHEA